MAFLLRRSRSVSAVLAGVIYRAPPYEAGYLSGAFALTLVGSGWPTHCRRGSSSPFPPLRAVVSDGVALCLDVWAVRSGVRPDTRATSHGASCSAGDSTQDAGIVHVVVSAVPASPFFNHPCGV